MHIVVNAVRYGQIDGPFVGALKPYTHQHTTLDKVRQALDARQTVCLINASVTGSGKTLANFAAAILDGTPTIGVYPTNELLTDQWNTLEPKLGWNQLAKLDSEGLDDLLSPEAGIRSHAQALAWVTGEALPPAALTNPDVLYLAMYDLYGQMYSTYDRATGHRIFQHVLTNYPVIAFDEFHLYNVKQIASAAFMVGTAARLAPDQAHVFIFSSATPESTVLPYLDRLGLVPVHVTAPPDPAGQVVCEEIEIDVLAADLLRWQGGETLSEALPDICRWADSTDPPAAGVFIVDSVYEAKQIADKLRRCYGAAAVGEVHGYMDRDARGQALERRFSVGTTTIDVGVDLTGKKSKEFLVAEARGAAAAIQRIGRLGRRGRERSSFPVPNRAWLIVPDYVYHFLKEALPDGTRLDRDIWSDWLKQSFFSHQTFAAYARRYAPLEAVAATERVLRQYRDLLDSLPAKQEALHTLVPTLYDRQPPATPEAAEAHYVKWHRQQAAVWRKFGQPVANSRSQFYLSDLESFRGGPDGQFTAAIYDELDEKLDIFPARTYNLAFVLRRARWDSMDAADYARRLRQRWPGERTEQELARIARQHVLGYVEVSGIIQGPANPMYFEADEELVGETFERVVKVSGLRIGPSDRRLRGINENLKKRSLNCWVSQSSSFYLSGTQHLPPLFALYPLRTRNLGGKLDDHEWSIAFGLDAFLLDSIYQGRPSRRQSVGGAILI